eukprot:TRINITY_DN7874_c0_g1_i2.p1 TRINITY_DN7874_c0_g1~~TRINITY_DN7874_c0_g1_i2.p1  ORF type:complete len:356 (+),score=77.06 TRINITY_DN7874_c0_g1_i2:1-1068(+)
MRDLPTSNQQRYGSGRTIWDPINSGKDETGRFSGGSPPPVQPASHLSSSWDAKPNYYPSTGNTHFSFLPRPETKPGNITPSYVSSSPRFSRARQVPIVQQGSQHNLTNGTNGTRTVPINQVEGQADGYGKPPSAGSRIRPFPRDPVTGKIQGEGYSGRPAQPDGYSGRPTRSTISSSNSGGQHGPRSSSLDTRGGASGLKSCLKSSSGHDSYKQNVVFQRSESEDRSKTRFDATGDYDWVDLSNQTSNGTAYPNQSRASRNDRVQVPINMVDKPTDTSEDKCVGCGGIKEVDSTKDIKTKPGSQPNKSQNGSQPTKSSQNGGSQNVGQSSPGSRPSSPCDACTQTEKKKSNCSVM